MSPLADSCVEWLTSRSRAMEIRPADSVPLRLRLPLSRIPSGPLRSTFTSISSSSSSSDPAFFPFFFEPEAQAGRALIRSNSRLSRLSYSLPLSSVSPGASRSFRRRFRFGLEGEMRFTVTGSNGSVHAGAFPARLGILTVGMSSSASESASSSSEGCPSESGSTSTAKSYKTLNVQNFLVQTDCSHRYPKDSLVHHQHPLRLLRLRRRRFG